ncbi:hypothetical protein [Pseudomonas aeruginosa]|uniref:hypothetical protein n=1 Tax=Pseudomonas aeruginosa TaxID=287 RepID=UPI003D089C99
MVSTGRRCSEALAIDRQPIPAVLSFDNYTLLIQAAIAGQGVAIGWHHLVDGLLEQGLLCRPIGGELPVAIRVL